MIRREQILQWLRNLEKAFEENRDYLTRLDAAIGDADHGINMDRGFRKVSSRLHAVENGDVGSILRETGMALVASVGGASGPLYGTFFIKAAERAAGKEALGARDIVDLFTCGISGLKERGKAQAGDKTMIDALEPALRALEHAVEEGKNLGEALRRASRSAEQGMKDTIPMVAKKGRASYMGERSAGHQDPGATSSYLMIKALSEVVT